MEVLESLGISGELLQHTELYRVCKATLDHAVAPHRLHGIKRTLTVLIGSIKINQDVYNVGDTAIILDNEFVTLEAQASEFLLTEHFLQTNPQLEFSQPHAIMYFFTAQWCKPCQDIHPLVATTHEFHKSITLREIDINQDLHSNLVERMNITQLPTFVLCDCQGTELGRYSGSSIQHVANLLESVGPS